ncbi:MAG: type II toxin-antitoxin system RelE/ParE family toxin [Coriobacteriales bacterium]|jgi:mRNA interferase RelE/StbE|nr:type II toxin-antitoxin system RelE/ParE family toxin [Coriobacteriales bacterium]
MTYQLKWHKAALRQFKKLDASVQRYIDVWLTKNVDGSSNPRRTGKSLTKDLSGYWRYRVGDYRVICEINDDACIVIAIKIGHRSKIYS